MQAAVPRAVRRKGGFPAFVVAAAVLVAAVGCGSQSERQRVAAALSVRAETSPVYARAFGAQPKVDRVTCNRGGRFRGRAAYFCELTLEDGSTTDACAMFVDDHLYTSVDSKGFRCTIPFK